jgi:hypothetical protein
LPSRQAFFVVLLEIEAHIYLENWQLNQSFSYQFEINIQYIKSREFSVKLPSFPPILFARWARYEGDRWRDAVIGGCYLDQMAKRDVNGA